jgi:GAF domain-containing protein
MSELQKQKLNIISQLSGLCAHCATNSQRAHSCPVQEIAARINSLRGVPLVVNNEFKGVLFARV